MADNKYKGDRHPYEGKSFVINTKEAENNLNRANNGSQSKNPILEIKKQEILLMNELKQRISELFKEAGIVYDNFSDYITALEIGLERFPVTKDMAKGISRASSAIDLLRALANTAENFQRILEEELGGGTGNLKELEDKLKTFLSELNQVKQILLDPKIITDPNKIEYFKKIISQIEDKVKDTGKISIDDLKNIDWGGIKENIENALTSTLHLTVRLFEEGIDWKGFGEALVSSTVLGRFQFGIQKLSNVEELLENLFTKDEEIVRDVEAEKKRREDFLSGLTEEQKAWWTTMFGFQDEIDDIEENFRSNMESYKKDYYERKDNLTFLDALLNRDDIPRIEKERKDREDRATDDREDKLNDLKYRKDKFEKENPYPVTEEQKKAYNIIMNIFTPENKKKEPDIPPAPASSTYVQKPNIIKMPSISQMERGNYGNVQSEPLSQQKTNQSASKKKDAPSPEEQAKPVIDAEHMKGQAIEATVQFVTAASEVIGKEIEMQGIDFEYGAQKVQETSQSKNESLDGEISKNQEVTQSLETELDKQNKLRQENADVVKKTAEENNDAQSDSAEQGTSFIGSILSKLGIQQESFGKVSDFMKKQFGVNIGFLKKFVKANNDAHDEMGKKTTDSVNTQINDFQRLAANIAEHAEKIMEGINFVTVKITEMFQSQIDDAKERLEEIGEKYDEVAEKKQESDDKIASLEEKARSAKGGALLVYQQQIDEEMAKNKQLANQEKDLAKQKEKQEKEIAKKERQMRKVELSQKIAQAIANVAMGVTSALSLGPIIGPILAAVIAVKGAIEVATMTKQMSKLEDGGLLEGKRHADGGMRIEGTNIEVEGGEYVVNRKSTKENLGLIGYINSKRRKLTPEDMSTYFQTGESAGVLATSRMMFADGGQLPVSVTDTNGMINNDQLVEAIRSIQIKPVVSVEDINHAQQHAVEVDSWIGM